jgi:hypothetical protein
MIHVTIIGKLPCGFKVLKLPSLGKTPIAQTVTALYLYCMKTTILLLSLVTLLSCSKSKDDTAPVKETVTFTAGATTYQSTGGEYMWKVILNTDKPATINGQATVTWDVYSAGTLMGSESKSFSYHLRPSHSFTVETGIVTRHGYSARNVKITALTAQGNDYILAY